MSITLNFPQKKIMMKKKMPKCIKFLNKVTLQLGEYQAFPVVRYLLNLKYHISICPSTRKHNLVIQ